MRKQRREKKNISRAIGFAGSITAMRPRDMKQEHPRTLCCDRTQFAICKTSKSRLSKLLKLADSILISMV
jgi:hypothetical protein